MTFFLGQIGIWPFLLTILPYLLFLWALLCHGFPIYRTRDLVITSNRLQRYVRLLFKVWQIATYGYLISCVGFALVAVSVPSSRLNQISINYTECAHSFSFNKCDSRKWSYSLLQKKCFALGMCISQPKYLIVVHELLLEWDHQVCSSLYWFIALVSLYVLITVKFSEEVGAAAPDSPGDPTPPQQVGHSDIAPDSRPRMRLRPPTPEERLHRHDRPEFPLPPVLQAGVPLPPPEGQILSFGALPENRAPDFNGNEERQPGEGSSDASSSENTTLFESEDETESPPQPHQIPGILN